MGAVWTITNPTGFGSSPLADFDLSDPVLNFRVMGVSTARMTATRNYDSTAPWWSYDQLVTIRRNNLPIYTGRVQESPRSASGSAETRVLELADAWLDLQEVIYREPWAIGDGSYLYPRCVLGRNALGANITTGEQIREVVDFAIGQGAAMQRGTIANGYQLWPSEARNQSCESIIVGELRFHPDWVAWLDHSTTPPTFFAGPKSGLSNATINIASGNIERADWNEVLRTKPLGVSIVYESANTIDGEVYRNAYLDEVGETSGRRVIRAMIDLEGMDVQYQKARVETRTLPTNPSSAVTYFKKAYPELKDIPDNQFEFSNVQLELVEEDAQPPPVSPQMIRITKANANELPRELVRGSIEDWMRVKVGRVLLKWKLKAAADATAENKKKMAPFLTLTEGMEAADEEQKVISVTATNAVTKLYKGVSSFTAGEGRPTGLAEGIFAAATEQQWEGQITLVDEDVPITRYHGRSITLMDGSTTLLSGAVIYSSVADIETGRVTLSFGPLPYLSAGDFLDLQRILNKRPVKWFSTQERTANTMGANGQGSSKGDNVSGYDVPNTVTPPGGGPGESLARQWKASAGAEGTIKCTGGVFTSQPDFSVIEVPDATGLSASASGYVVLNIARADDTRAVTGTPSFAYEPGSVPASTSSLQKVPIAKVTVEDLKITKIIPLVFEELHVFEDLAVVNGEMQLVSLLMAPRNTYDLPDESPPPP